MRVFYLWFMRVNLLLDLKFDIRDLIFIIMCKALKFDLRDLIFVVTCKDWLILKIKKKPDNWYYQMIADTLLDIASIIGPCGSFKNSCYMQLVLL
jgi:hypothetical protein